MSKKSPEAFDPLLQDKIDYLTRNPDKYFIQNEIDRQVHELETREREIRAMLRECDRAQITIGALRKALVALTDNAPKQQKTKFEKV